MSVHISAKEGQIAETVLLPGDPLRAKFIAENLLENAECYNEVRGMLGFTGTYKGKRVSVQGSGMGIPSMSIYATELIRNYGAKNLIRIGTCGAISEKVKLRSIVLAQTASTTAKINNFTFGGRTFAPTASFNLLYKAYKVAMANNIETYVGQILTTEMFYNPQDFWRKWAHRGALVVDMETAGLYTVAAKHNVNALAILTASDSLVSHEVTTAEERQNSFINMMKVALEIA